MIHLFWIFSSSRCHDARSRLLVRPHTKFIVLVLSQGILVKTYSNILKDSTNLKSPKLFKDLETKFQLISKFNWFQINLANSPINDRYVLEGDHRWGDTMSIFSSNYDWDKKGKWFWVKWNVRGARSDFHSSSQMKNFYTEKLKFHLSLSTYFSISQLSSRKTMIHFRR